MIIPAIIAHRGASYLAPENTLAAVRLAWELGADAVEVDVHLTRDGEIVVCHDATTGRTCGEDLTIAQCALADLKRLDAGSWKGPDWAGEPMATLAEVIDTLPGPGSGAAAGGRRLFIEAKAGVEIVDPLVKAIDASGRPTEAFVVISFSWDVVAQVKARRPALTAYWLHAFRQDEATGEWSPAIEAIIAKALEARVEGVNLAAQAPILDPRAGAAVRAAGLALYAWTVDDAEAARRLAALGAQGLTTNRPGYLREALTLR